MQVNRRDFFVSAVAAGAGLSAVGSVARAAEGESKVTLTPKRQATLKLSVQEGIVPGGSLKEKLDKMERWGYIGLEIGGHGLARRVKQYKEALQGRPIKMSAICAGFDGVLGSEKPEIRSKAVQSMKEILTAAAELESSGLIIVPAFNGQTTLSNKELRELLVPLQDADRAKTDRAKGLLEELGEHAVKVGSRILLEPLNRRECYFLRQLADAAAICKDVNSPGICMMGDFWHMTWEETNDMAAFMAAGDYLRHVHIASRKRRAAPSEDEGDNYVVGMRGLKAIGYQDFISLECGVKGDKEQVLPAAAKLIREQWEQA